MPSPGFVGFNNRFPSSSLLSEPWRHALSAAHPLDLCTTMIDQPLRYYRTLEAANAGDVRPFVRFVAQCADRTLGVYLWAEQELNTEVRL